jgi:hypothetical protein
LYGALAGAGAGVAFLLPMAVLATLLTWVQSRLERP